MSDPICVMSCQVGVFSSDNFSKHHHRDCPNYSKEKFPYLMYYEEAIDGWTFAPERVENIIDLFSMEEGDYQWIDIKFRRTDMTDAEYDAMPEC